MNGFSRSAQRWIDLADRAAVVSPSFNAQGRTENPSAVLDREVRP
jgi:hypothetical protein